MLPNSHSGLEARVHTCDNYVSTGRPLYGTTGEGIYPVNLLKYPVVIEDPRAPNRFEQRYMSNRERGSVVWDNLVDTIQNMHGEYATYLRTFSKLTRPYIAEKVGPLNGRKVRYFGAMVSKGHKVGAALMPLRKTDQHGNVSTDFKEAILFKDAFGMAQGARDLAIKMGIPDAYGIMFLYFHEDIHLHGEMGEGKVYELQADFYKGLAAKTAHPYYKAIYAKLSLVASTISKNVDQIYSDLMNGNLKGVADLLAAELGISTEAAMGVARDMAGDAPQKAAPAKAKAKKHAAEAGDGGEAKAGTASAPKAGAKGSRGKKGKAGNSTNPSNSEGSPSKQ